MKAIPLTLRELDAVTKTVSILEWSWLSIEIVDLELHLTEAAAPVAIARLRASELAAAQTAAHKIAVAFGMIPSA